MVNREPVNERTNETTIEKNTREREREGERSERVINAWRGLIERRRRKVGREERVGSWKRERGNGWGGKDTETREASVCR